MAANPQDTNALFELANAYQAAKNWNGEITAWKKMSGLLPDWAPSYYSQGIAYQQLQNDELANIAFEKYVTLVKPEEVEANKSTLAYAHFSIANFIKDKDVAKAKMNIEKALFYNPSSENALKLKSILK